jgi:predicted nucleotidyltransferase component of viral defense system
MHKKSSDPQEVSAEVRDLIQGRMISQFFAQNVVQAVKNGSDATHLERALVLKGGMAMAVAHDHARQTKDIDLDADAEMELHVVQRTVRRGIKDALAGGQLRDVKVTEPKQTHTTARWNIEGTIPATGHILHLTVEISFRHRVTQGEVVHVPFKSHPTDPSSNILVYRDEVLALNKVGALFTRDAPRDVVDLFLLFQAGVEFSPPALAQCLTGRALDGTDTETLIGQMWAKLEAMDEATFQNQVVPVWNLTTAVPEWKDWDAVRLLVGEKISAGLREADVHRPRPRSRG